MGSYHTLKITKSDAENEWALCLDGVHDFTATTEDLGALAYDLVDGLELPVELDCASANARDIVYSATHNADVDWRQPGEGTMNPRDFARYTNA